MRPSDSFEIKGSDGEPETLVRVGPAAHSLIYQSSQAWYRVFPAEIPLKWKNDVRQQLNQSFPACLTPCSFEPHESHEWFLLRYPREPGSISLSEVLSSGEVQAGLEAVAAILRSLTEWWSHGLLPIQFTPADIVCSSNGRAELLRSPRWRMISATDIFEESQRARYLAPESLRLGSPATEVEARALDLFTVGVTLLDCFFDVEPAVEPGEALLRAATATTREGQRRRDSLPFWIEQIPATQTVIALGRQLSSAAPLDRVAKLNLIQTADYLSSCRQRMEPRSAVREAREQNPAQAFSLLEDLLLDHESFDLLMEGGDLAEEIGKELHALRFYERAMTIVESRPEPYEKHFDLIASACQHPLSKLHLLYETNLEFSTTLDRRIREDFEALARWRPEWADDREVILARHYLLRGRSIATRFQSAREFIRSRLYDSDRAFRSWKLELRLLDCELLLEQGSTAAAVDLFNKIQPDLMRYQKLRNSQIDPIAVQRAVYQAKLLRSRLVPPAQGNL